MAQLIRKFLEIKQSTRKFVLTTLSAKILADITYTAVRGVDKQEGAVQRVLTTQRIRSVKEFVLAGGDLPGAIVLNWQEKLSRKGDTILINPAKNLAQIIDGQHRVAGLAAAIDEDPKFGKIQIPIVLYEQLTTQECADIFLSINTQQKTVPRSLVFDLYGVASDITTDPAIVRARDIAEHLNVSEASPYYDLIKFPGDKRRRGGVALSSAVSAIKELVGQNGSFEQIGVRELEVQITCILNFFNALQKEYGKEWEQRTNAFLYSAGFTAACQFLQLIIVPYCKTHGSFESKEIQRVIKLKQAGLILQEEVKSQSGGEAVKIIYSRLQEAFKPKGTPTTLRF